MKRQSAVLLSKVSQHEQLHKAVMEIESLSEKIEDQKTEYEKQVSVCRLGQVIPIRVCITQTISLS